MNSNYTIGTQNFGGSFQCQDYYHLYLMHQAILAKTNLHCIVYPQASDYPFDIFYLFLNYL